MDGFKAFWNANTMMIAIGCAVVAVAIAFAGLGQLSAAVAAISGIAFMWMARPAPPVDDDEA